MFNLNNKQVKLTTLTTRTEGADIPAISLRCVISMSNTVLDDFAPGLLTSFFEKQKKDQVELIKSDMLPDLKFKKMEKFSWKEEFENVLVRINEEIEQDNARFIFPDCTLKNFKFELKQGGTVDVEFTINCNPEPDAVGWLYGHQKKTMPMTIEAGEEPQLHGFDDIESDDKAPLVLDPKTEKLLTFIKEKGETTIEPHDVANHFQWTDKKARKLLGELVDAELISEVLGQGYFYTAAEEVQEA